MGIVKVAPSTYLLSPPPLGLVSSPPPPPHPARRAAVTQRPRAEAASFIDGSCRRMCGGSGSGAPDGATDVQVEGVALSVVPEEDVRQVHAVLGLQRDQAVVAERHELLADRRLAEVLEHALRRGHEPDAAVVVLAGGS